MKQIIFFLSCLFCVNIYAQSNFYYAPEARQVLEERLPIEYSRPDNVREITFDVQDMKKGKTKRFVREYNDDGRPVLYAKITSKGTKQAITAIDYDVNGKVSETRQYRKGKLHKTRNYQRTTEGKASQETLTNKRGKVLHSNTWEYNDDGCLARRANYGKNPTRPRSSWIFEYADDCQKSQSTWYNARGKVIGVWSYDCDDVQRQKKDPPKFQLCRWDENTEDHLKMVLQSTNPKGGVTKTVFIYTRDTLLLEMSTYNEGERLVSKRTFDKSYKKPLSAKHFNKEGKEIRSSSYEYKNGRLATKTVHEDGRLTQRSEMMYDGGGLLFQVKRYGAQDKLEEVISLSYKE